MAASLISWLGGGVQPANRQRLGFFDDAAPIWLFKERLGATENPERSRAAASGLFWIEVFPAVALASMAPAFYGRLAAPHYNPARRRTFRIGDWCRIIDAVAAASANVCGPREWCDEHKRMQTPQKPDQDKLDAIICALVGLRWRTARRAGSIMIGDLQTGYMIAPVTQDVRARLTEAAARIGVPIE
ncbi:MAG: DUF429 domain-containing protein [Alphaproteobacteria bacterium]|nr:DUF429 domain-containing protein [Alphaproteobacteria bacterium]